eukprot:768518-Hanusia_phi.AAC.8
MKIEEGKPGQNETIPPWRRGREEGEGEGGRERREGRRVEERATRRGAREDARCDGGDQRGTPVPKSIQNRGDIPEEVGNRG